MNNQQRDDAIIEDPARKSIGAYLVAMALIVTAAYAPLPLWAAVLIGGTVWWGLHMVAGLRIKWRYR